MLNRSLVNHIENCLRRELYTKVDAINVKRVRGGDINDTYQLIANGKKYFLKINSSIKHPLMFVTEHKGLEILKKASNFSVPEVYFTGEHEKTCFLLMEWMDLSSKGDWQEFGVSLANLHQNKSEYFGLDHDNFIGSLPQTNKQTILWSEYYADQRILPLFKIAFDQGKFENSDEQHLMQFINRIDEIYPREKASLLHGDLWSGNADFCNGKPAVFDPAVYYGHREMDLAMTLLFGGFPSEMYQSYHETYPLERSWKERIEISQLYPLLVHAILFGESYASQVKRILKRF